MEMKHKAWIKGKTRFLGCSRVHWSAAASACRAFCTLIAPLLNCSRATSDQFQFCCSPRRRPTFSWVRVCLCVCLCCARGVYARVMLLHDTTLSANVQLREFSSHTFSSLPLNSARATSTYRSEICVIKFSLIRALLITPAGAYN